MVLTRNSGVYLQRGAKCGSASLFGNHCFFLFEKKERLPTVQNGVLKIPSHSKTDAEASTKDENNLEYFGLYYYSSQISSLF